MPVRTLLRAAASLPLIPEAAAPALVSASSPSEVRRSEVLERAGLPWGTQAVVISPARPWRPAPALEVWHLLAHASPDASPPAVPSPTRDEHGRSPPCSLSLYSKIPWLRRAWTCFVWKLADLGVGSDAPPAGGRAHRARRGRPRPAKQRQVAFAHRLLVQAAPGDAAAGLGQFTHRRDGARTPSASMGDSIPQPVLGAERRAEDGTARVSQRRTAAAVGAWPFPQVRPCRWITVVLPPGRPARRGSSRGLHRHSLD